VTEMS
jgi:hypothetical protein